MKDTKGMTLVEVIIAMAIIGIVAIAILSIFSSGFSLIRRAGDKSRASFVTHSQIETVLNQRDTDPSPSNLTITFTSDGSTISSEGNIETLSQPYRNGNVNITIFQPKY